MCGGWVGIDLSHRVGGRVWVAHVIRFGLFSRTLVLRLTQVRHGCLTVGVQVVFEGRSNNSVQEPEKRL